MRHNLATSRSIAWGHHDCLMLTISSCGWASSFSYRIGIMMILTCLRSVINWFVAPVSWVNSTLWTLIMLRTCLFAICTHTSISEMSGYRLDCGVIEPRHLFTSLMTIVLTTCNYRFHHKVVCFDYWRMNYCSELLIISHRHLTCSKSSIIVSLMLWAIELWSLCGIRLTFRHIHIYCSPWISLILSTHWLVNRWRSSANIRISALLCLLHHLGWSQTCVCCANWMLISSVASNHWVFGVLGRSVRSIVRLQRMMARAITMSDCHIHAILDILLCLLRELRLIPHMLSVCLIESTCHAHYLSLVAVWISVTAFVHSISIVIVLRTICCCLSHGWWLHLSRIVSCSSWRSSFIVRSTIILRAISNSWVLRMNCIIDIHMSTWMRDCLELRSIVDCSNFNWWSYSHGAHLLLAWLSLSVRNFIITATMAHCWCCTSLWLTFNRS